VVPVDLRALPSIRRRGKGLDVKEERLRQHFHRRTLDHAAVCRLSCLVLTVREVLMPGVILLSPSWMHMMYIHDVQLRALEAFSK